MTGRENLGDVVRFWGRAIPDREAVVDGDVVTTWSELDDRTNRLANGLRKLGLSSGDRLGLLAPNCREFVDVVVAANKLGAITVPLNHRLTATELRYVIEHSGCQAVVVHAAFVDAATRALDDISADGRTQIERIGLAPGFGHLFTDLLSDDATDPDEAVSSSDVAFICYTSGTTGLPKGAMLTHGNILAVGRFRNLADDLYQRARLYLPAPLAFTGTLATWATAHVGGGLTVLDTVMEPRRCLETIERYAISHFAAVPVIWEMMLRDPDFARFDLSSLRACVTGGATVTEAFLRSMWDAGLPVRNGYGLTESSGYSAWQSIEDSRRAPESVGRAGAHSRFRIVDRNADRLIDVPTGDVGEIAIQGPEVMLGYWNDPAATAATLVDGWLRTGDLGRLTADGDLHIVGRIKDMFISGGLNVYPAEVEGVLAAIDGVAECAVIGIPDDRWGETGAAIICPVPGNRLDPVAISEHCAIRLADYKRPRYVVLRDTPLPRNMSGKVLKHDLVQEYSDPGSLGPRVR